MTDPNTANAPNAPNTTTNEAPQAPPSTEQAVASQEAQPQAHRLFGKIFSNIGNIADRARRSKYIFDEGRSIAADIKDFAERFKEVASTQLDARELVSRIFKFIRFVADRQSKEKHPPGTFEVAANVEADTKEQAEAWADFSAQMSALERNHFDDVVDAIQHQMTTDAVGAASVDTQAKLEAEACASGVSGFVLRYALDLIGRIARDRLRTN